MMKRAYQGAVFNRLTSDWVLSSTSADSEIYTALRPLRNRSRDLIRNNDSLEGAVGKIVDNVIGNHGIPFQSQVKTSRGNLDNKTNSLIESAWKSWAESGCDTSEKLHFCDMQRLIFRSLIESGEVLVRVIRQPFGKSRIPFALELIEADQLAEDYAVGNLAGNHVRMGVELDQWNRPVAYHLYPFHPGDYQFSSSVRGTRLMRVSAFEIFHLFIVKRIGQTRGVPWLASSLIRSKHLAGFEEAEAVKARGQASFMGFLKSPDPSTMGEVDETGQVVSDFSPGEIFQLQPGQEFQGFAPTSPGQQFDPFVRAMLRGISAGIGMSYESLSNDYSNTSYSSARQSILGEREIYKGLQEWFIRTLLKPLFEQWLEMAVMSNVLPLPDYELKRGYYCCPKFIPRRWDWVDPSKDISAKTTALDKGITSLTQIIAETGRDIEEVFSEIQREEQLKKTLGIFQPPPEPEEPSLITTAKEWRVIQNLRKASESIMR
jgi:lambda family phage portal protein